MAPITKILTLIALASTSLAGGHHSPHHTHPSGSVSTGPSTFPTGGPFPMPNSTLSSYPTGSGTGTATLPSLTPGGPHGPEGPHGPGNPGNGGSPGGSGLGNSASSCPVQSTVTVTGEPTTVTVTATASNTGTETNTDGGNGGSSHPTEAPTPPYPIPSGSNTSGTGPTGTGTGTGVPSGTGAPSASATLLRRYDIEGVEKFRQKRRWAL